MALSLTSEPATHLKMTAAVSDRRVFVIYDHVMTWHVVREQRPIENRVNWGVRWRLKKSPYDSYSQASVNLVAIGVSNSCEKNVGTKSRKRTLPKTVIGFPNAECTLRALSYFVYSYYDVSK